MKFRIPVADAGSVEIEVTGLPPGTCAEMNVRITNGAGTGPATSVPLSVPALIPTLPAAPVVVCDGSDSAEQPAKETGQEETAPAEKDQTEEAAPASGGGN